MTRRDELRRQALKDLQDFHVLMIDGHFDYGNGLHGRVYLNPHQLFRQPATIWRFAQDLLEILPEALLESTEVVVGPVMGGALLAHTIAGLLDARRSLTHAPTSFAPLSIDAVSGLTLRPFYHQVVRGKRVLLADDVRNSGKTFERAKHLIDAAGGRVVATVEIYDRLEAMVDLGVPNFALAEYQAPENFPVASCPMCKQGVPVTTF